MKVIEGTGHLNTILNTYSTRNSYTNNYFLLAAFEKLIISGRLSYIATKDNLCLLESNDDYYRIYYYLNNTAEPLDMDYHKPAVMEIIYKGSAGKPDNIIKYWYSCGFRDHITRDNMALSFNKLQIPSEVEDENPLIKIIYADKPSEAEYAYRLIKNTFDRYTGDILTLSQVTQFMERRMILCAYYNKKIAGMLQFEIKNNVIFIGHLAVDPKFGGIGIASRLIKAYITLNATQFNRFQLWVINTNTRAKNLYYKFGFIYGNKSSCSLIKD